MSALLDIESSAVVPAVLPGIARVAHPEYTPKVLPFRSRTAIPQVGEVAHPEYSQKVSPGLMRLPAASPGAVSLRVLIPDFNLGIDAAVVQFAQDKDAGQILIRVAIDANVEANIEFAGRLTEHESSFEIAQVSFRLAPTKDCAQADFVASTINAALALSQRVQIQMPEAGLDLALGFDLPLIEISRLLQSRQTTYRLMTIEQATGIRFDLPREGFSGNDIGAINFAFRSIVERRFVFLLNSVQVYVEASKDGAERLESLKESDELTYGPTPMTKNVLGIGVGLGPQTVRISDPFIEGLERVEQEVLRRDRRVVPVVIRSHTNQAIYELPEAPRLATDAWGNHTQHLINLELELDSHLFERYNTLAAGSLAGLTEEEKELVTQRPEISYPIDETDD
jgi:hypothetical protein